MDRFCRGLNCAPINISVKAMYKHPLGNKHAGVETTYRLQADKSVVIDVLDQEPDFIHMGGDHNPWAAVSSLRPDHISHYID
jgi:hypothetical protein